MHICCCQTSSSWPGKKIVFVPASCRRQRSCNQHFRSKPYSPGLSADAFMIHPYYSCCYNTNPRAHPKIV
jgi:hypothetical protein